MRKVVACEIPPLIRSTPTHRSSSLEVLSSCSAALRTVSGLRRLRPSPLCCLDSAGYRGGHQPRRWVTQMRGVEGKLTKLPSLDQRRDLSGVREEITKISRSRSAMQRASAPQQPSRCGAPRRHAGGATTGGGELVAPLALAGLLLLGGVATQDTSEPSQDARCSERAER